MKNRLLMFKQSNAIMYIGNLYITLSLVLVSFPHSQKIEIQVKAFHMTKCIRIIIPFTEAHILLTSGNAGSLVEDFRQRDEGSLLSSFS